MWFSNKIQEVCKLSYLLLILAHVFGSAENLLNGRESDLVNSERILSRQRRYLVFPLGSSFQLVYDQEIYVPDYGVYLQTGVIVALSWGLPDKPTYPEYELMESYENGSLPLLENRNDRNITEFNRKGEINIRTNITNNNKYPAKSEFWSNAWNYYNLLQRRRKIDSYYFKQVDGLKSDQSHDSNKLNGIDYDSVNVQSPYSPKFNEYDAFTNYMIETYFKPWFESDSYKATLTTTKKPETKPIIRKLNTVYPAMGKRSIRDPTASYEEKFFLDHHRHTRHEVYNIIEKYLFAKGLNGTACVLRTLCEVGERRHENEPGSFLSELIRVIFSLPVAQLKHVVDKRHIAYDEAHQSENCAMKYKNCPNSIWDLSFVIETINNSHRVSVYDPKK